jgi:hypothetical protein
VIIPVCCAFTPDAAVNKEIKNTIRNKKAILSQFIVQIREGSYFPALSSFSRELR